MNTWTTIAQSTGAISLALAAGTFLYNEHARRQHIHRSNAQGLTFTETGGWIQTIDHTARTQYSSTIITIEPTGPGQRHDLRCLLWINDTLVAAKNPKLKTFDSTSDPLHIEVQVHTTDTDTRNTTQIGITWAEPFAKGFRNEYVRYNPHNRTAQIWRWNKPFRPRRWINEKRRLHIPGTGKKRPLGKWTTHKLDNDIHWYGPTRERNFDDPATIKLTDGESVGLNT